MNDEDGATRIYLSVPAATPLRAGGAAASQLAALAAQLDVACVNLALPLADEGDAAALVRSLQNKGIAVLAGIDPFALLAAPGGPDLDVLRQQAALARRLGCDGLHLPGDERLIAAARAVLPADAIIGVACGTSRHQAMLAGEAGADYVAFAGASEAVADILVWWQELFEVPCVAWHVDDPALLDELLRLPAEFIAPAPVLWDDADVIARLAAAAPSKGD